MKKLASRVISGAAACAMLLCNFAAVPQNTRSKESIPQPVVSVKAAGANQPANAVVSGVLPSEFTLTWNNPAGYSVTAVVFTEIPDDFDIRSLWETQSVGITSSYTSYLQDAGLEDTKENRLKFLRTTDAEREDMAAEDPSLEAECEAIHAMTVRALELERTLPEIEFNDDRTSAVFKNLSPGDKQTVLLMPTQEDGTLTASENWLQLEVKLPGFPVARNLTVSDISENYAMLQWDLTDEEPTSINVYLSDALPEMAGFEGVVDFEEREQFTEPFTADLFMPLVPFFDLKPGTLYTVLVQMVTGTEVRYSLTQFSTLASETESTESTEAADTTTTTETTTTATESTTTTTETTTTTTESTTTAESTTTTSDTTTTTADSTAEATESTTTTTAIKPTQTITRIMALGDEVTLMQADGAVYTSSDPEIVSVNENGVAKTLAPGTADVYVTLPSGDIIDYKITVNAPLEVNATPGDVNGDGEINAVDASDLLFAAALIGAGEKSGLNATQQKAADVDGNTEINAVDASIILQYAAAVGAGETAELTDFI